MKNYLLYFLCVVLCVALTPTVYNLMPDGLKADTVAVSEPPDESGSSAPEENKLRDSVKVVFKRTGDVVTYKLDDYVAAVLEAELPRDAPYELLKVMAVVVRTYAVYHMYLSEKHGEADLCDDGTHCRCVSREVTDERVKKAAEETAGEVICHEGLPIDPITHISSSVKTESAENVFGVSVPYLVSVLTPDESAMKLFRNDKAVSTEEFRRALAAEGIDISESIGYKSWIGYISYNESGRVKSVAVCGHTVSGTDMMRIFGLKSANFTVTTGTDGFVFTTEGIGHGVGLSVYGAWLMAEEGASYKNIIKHFYSEVYIAVN